MFCGRSPWEAVGLGVVAVAALGLPGWVWLGILLEGPQAPALEDRSWRMAGAGQGTGISSLHVGLQMFRLSAKLTFPFGSVSFELLLLLPHPASRLAGGWGAFRPLDGSELGHLGSRGCPAG